ncbi:hypothetical protein WJX74_008621 [Apatococcus lobatus]|uniref:Uncharacterized protein n=1 Tax=Apatococcus lobatus TaxID=904363 RepID=A0AAW1S6C9_9CHLO
METTACTDGPVQYGASAVHSSVCGKFTAQEDQLAVAKGTSIQQFLDFLQTDLNIRAHMRPKDGSIICMEVKADSSRQNQTKAATGSWHLSCSMLHRVQTGTTDLVQPPSLRLTACCMMKSSGQNRQSILLACSFICSSGSQTLRQYIPQCSSTSLSLPTAGMAQSKLRQIECYTVDLDAIMPRCPLASIRCSNLDAALAWPVQWGSNSGLITIGCKSARMLTFTGQEYQLDRGMQGCPTCWCDAGKLKWLVADDEAGLWLLTCHPERTQPLHMTELTSTAPLTVASCLTLLPGWQPSNAEDSASGTLFIGSSTCDSQLLHLPAGSPPHEGRGPGCSQPIINEAESKLLMPCQMIDSALICNPSPIHHSLTIPDELDELQGTSNTAGALLLCCGQAPRGSIRMGRMAVKLVSPSGSLASLQGYSEIVAVSQMQPWGMDALLAFTGLQNKGSSFLALRGNTADPVEIAGICKDQATLLLHLLPDGLLCQVTEQDMRVIGTAGVCAVAKAPSNGFQMAAASGATLTIAGLNQLFVYHHPVAGPEHCSQRDVKLHLQQETVPEQISCLTMFSSPETDKDQGMWLCIGQWQANSVIVERVPGKAHSISPKNSGYLEIPLHSSRPTSMVAMSWMTGLLLLVGTADGCVILHQMEPCASEPTGSASPAIRLHATRMVHIGSSHVHLSMLPAAVTSSNREQAARVMALADHGAALCLPNKTCRHGEDALDQVTVCRIHDAGSLAAMTVLSPSQDSLRPSEEVVLLWLTHDGQLCGGHLDEGPTMCWCTLALRCTPLRALHLPALKCLLLVCQDDKAAHALILLRTSSFQQVAKLQLGSGQQVHDMCIAQLPCTSEEGRPADNVPLAKHFVVLAGKALSSSKQLAYQQGLLSVLEVSSIELASQRWQLLLHGTFTLQFVPFHVVPIEGPGASSTTPPQSQQAMIVAGHNCISTWRIHITNPTLEQRMAAAKVSIDALSNAAALDARCCSSAASSRKAELQNMLTSSTLRDDSKETNKEQSSPSWAIKHAHCQLIGMQLQQIRLEEGILALAKADAALYVLLESRRLLLLKLSVLMGSLLLLPRGSCMLNEAGCDALPSQPLPILNSYALVAGHLGMWTVSRDKEGEAEFDALQQLQHAAAHEAFSSLLPTREAQDLCDGCLEFPKLPSLKSSYQLHASSQLSQQHSYLDLNPFIDDFKFFSAPAGPNQLSKSGAFWIPLCWFVIVLSETWQTRRR